MQLPWQLISRLTPELGADPVYVWNGVEMRFAQWKYDWLMADDLNPDEPCWCEDNSSIALDPQPTHYLPLVPPGVDIETTFPK